MSCQSKVPLHILISSITHMQRNQGTRITHPRNFLKREVLRNIKDAEGWGPSDPGDSQLPPSVSSLIKLWLRFSDFFHEEPSVPLSLKRWKWNYKLKSVKLCTLLSSSSNPQHPDTQISWKKQINLHQAYDRARGKANSDASSSIGPAQEFQGADLSAGSQVTWIKSLWWFMGLSFYNIKLCNLSWDTSRWGNKYNVSHGALCWAMSFSYLQDCRFQHFFKDP